MGQIRESSTNWCRNSTIHSANPRIMGLSHQKKSIKPIVMGISWDNWGPPRWLGVLINGFFSKNHVEKGANLHHLYLLGSPIGGTHVFMTNHRPGSIHSPYMVVTPKQTMDFWWSKTSTNGETSAPGYSFHMVLVPMAPSKQLILHTCSCPLSNVGHCWAFLRRLKIKALQPCGEVEFYLDGDMVSRAEFLAGWCSTIEMGWWSPRTQSCLRVKTPISSIFCWVIHMLLGFVG